MKMCEIEGCPAAVSRAIADRIEPTDERAHLCPGHAYALVMLIEERTENQSVVPNMGRRGFNPSIYERLRNSREASSRAAVGMAPAESIGAKCRSFELTIRPNGRRSARGSSGDRETRRAWSSANAWGSAACIRWAARGGASRSTAGRPCLPSAAWSSRSRISAENRIARGPIT